MISIYVQQDVQENDVVKNYKFKILIFTTFWVLFIGLRQYLHC